MVAIIGLANQSSHFYGTFASSRHCPPVTTSLLSTKGLNDTVWLVSAGGEILRQHHSFQAG